jgi:hypothetical protein
MVKTEVVGFLRRLGRFLVDLNLFETDDTDERTIHVQRWSTRAYICVLCYFICILLFQDGLHVETRLIEVRNPSLESYIKLQNLYGDVNCPCSQISVSYGSFVMLAPIYHSICSSGFISQTWIEMLSDKMTAFRFVGDFRATAGLQFQILRELCQFSQSALNNDILSFYDSEFISGSLLNEDQWHVEIGTAIAASLDNSFTNVKHRISFFRSFVKYNLLVSGIETSIVLELEMKNGLTVVNLQPISYQVFEKANYCECDNDVICYFPSSIYNVGLFDIYAQVFYYTLESQRSFVLKDWFVGCWALESLLLSSFNNSFLNNQTELNLIAMYFNWASDSILPTVLNLNESNKINGSTGTFNDLLQTFFVENVVTELNYSVYFEQCRAQSCFYSIKQHSSFLDIFTSLLALYGGLSVVLRFLIPLLVAFLIKHLTHPAEAPVDIGEFQSRFCFDLQKRSCPKIPHGSTFHDCKSELSI